MARTAGEPDGKDDRGDENERARREARTRRAEKVRDAIAGREGQTRHRTSKGDINLGEIRFVPASDAEAALIEVTVGRRQGGEPDYRIVNPPLYVADPDGTVDLDGVPHREDPVAALAELVAQFTGPARRRRRR